MHDHARDGETPEVAGGEFTVIYDEHYSDVARWIRALGGPASDQDDLIQEVFSVVLRRLSHFDGQNLRAWLYRITAHQVRDFRRLTWFRHIFQRSEPLTPDVAACGQTPIMALETREKQRRLDALLARLSHTLRTTFILFEIEGYTAEEIASLQEAPLNTVRARILRARKKLTAMLEDQREAEGGGNA